MRSIGELARASGLTVSALRFYDRCGVLTPALVDPVTGYRWYAGEQVAPARLVAGLRRVGLPLAEIGVALRHRHEPAVVGRLLDAHLRRLEDGLADVRRELSRIRALLDPEEIVMTTTITLAAGDLAAAVDAVRFAVGGDPELPVLSGVLFDVEPDGVRLVATDRHRLAVARATGAVDGPVARALLPVVVVDALRLLLGAGPAPAGSAAGGAPDAGTATVTLTGTQVAVAVGGREVAAPTMPDDFPDYRRLLHPVTGEPRAHRYPVDAAALRAVLRAPDLPTVRREHDGRAYAVTVLGADDRGLRVVGPDESTAGLRVGVDGRYLLDALDAAGDGQLVLELDGPIAPLAIRRRDDEDAFSILMPIRL
ncbi:MerR family transcriptional regulator [Micromonospora sp. KC606]|uniref:DNA polymerase III subunit beta family protein n=1 Tax=Micromonospora sp. KC606 TaxID=2530379 RepID=UPI00104F871D|nr:MerR family transcriptional regulator [Micromonospora sp. KC606]TDC73592.1 MerR family transcriptional regulator [Micromonospora sp. KC606]